MIYNSALELIGNTPIIRLNNIDSNIYLKLEKFNIGGSIKDRAVLGMIEDKIKNKENYAHNRADCPCRAFDYSFESAFFNNPGSTVVFVEKFGIFVASEFNLLGFIENHFVYVAFALDFETDF